MKNKLTILFVFLCIKALAQAPQSFSYQAIARDKDQKPLANASLTVEASILRNNQAVFKENHSAQTSGTGLFTLDIGSVNALAFQSINWALGGFSLQIKVSGDVNINVPAEPIQSVPYALYAAKTDPAGIRLTLDGNTLGIEGGNSVVLPSNSSSTSLTINGQGLFLGGTATTGYVLQNTGDTNPADDLTTASTASGDVSGKFQSLSVDKIKGQPLSGTTPQMGQILQWDGTVWKPSAAPAAGLSAISTDATLAGNGTTAVPLQLARQNAQPNQVLKWNGSSWVPADDVAATAPPGTVAVAAALTGDGSTGKPLNLAQQGAQTGQVLKWNGSAWAPAPDETLPGEAGGDLSGPFSNLSIRANSINSSHIAPGTIGAQDLSSMGAAPGEFLMYDGTQWVTKPIIGGSPSYTEGPGIDISGNTIANTGDLDSTDDLLKTTQAGGDLQGVFADLQIKNGAVTGAKVAQMGATNGQVLKWDGSMWKPQNDIGGGIGDNWGTQDVVTSGATLFGKGTAASPLTLIAGTATGQVLKWDGSTWKPAADETGSGGGGATTVTVTGSGLGITGNAAIGYTLRNTGDTEAGDDVTINSQAGGDLSGTFPSLLIKDNAVVTNKIANGAVNGSKIAQMSATNGQVLKWDGSKWGPATDETGSGGSGATTFNVTGAGLRLTGNTTTGYTLQNTGDIDSTNDVTKATLAGGALSGVFANLQINNGAVTSTEISDGSIGIQDLSNMGAQDGQVLKYNSSTSRWAPATISGSSQWTTDANGIYYPPSNGDGTVRVNNGFGAKLLEMGPSSKTIPTQFSAYGHNTAGSLATYGANGQMNVYLTHLIDQNGNPLPNNGALSIYGTDGYRPYPPFIAYAAPDNSGSFYLTNAAGQVAMQGSAVNNAGALILNNSNKQPNIWLGTGGYTDDYGFLGIWGPQKTGRAQVAVYADSSSNGNGILEIKNASGSNTSTRVLAGAASHDAGVLGIYGSSGKPIIVMGGFENAPNQGFIHLVDQFGIPQVGLELNSLGQGVLFKDINSFRMVHPRDTAKEIWYACIEGPEAAAYERGTARLINGEAWIPFSEHFQEVINPTTMTVLLTPLSIDTDGLAVVEKTATGVRIRELRGGRGNFNFDWEVKGVRKGYEDYQAVRLRKDASQTVNLQRNQHVMPQIKAYGSAPK